MVGQNAARHASRTKKIVLGLAGISTALMIGTAGIAAAAPGGNDPVTPPQSFEDCANWEQLGFKNHGQCVSWWAHNGKPGHPGHGYGDGDGYGNGDSNGSDNQVDTDTAVDLNVNGNNNVITIVWNYVFGR